MNSLDLIRENSRSKGFLNLLIPYYEGLSIVNILPTILNSLGYKCNLKELDYRFINKAVSYTHLTLPTNREV